MAYEPACLRSTVSKWLLPLFVLALVGCSSKEPEHVMTLQDAKYILANAASQVQPLEVARDAILADLDRHENPRRGERPPNSTRAELQQSLAKVEADLTEHQKRVELAKEVVAKEAAKAK